MNKMIPKYPRTFHFPFSPNISNNDRIIKDISPFLNKQLIITEKLDGDNTAIYNGEVYSRSNTSTASHESFNIIKNIFAWKTINIKDKVFYGENLYRVHSITYNNLSSYFYVFNILSGNIWLPWKNITDICQELDFKTVPYVDKKVFKSSTELKDFLLNEINKESILGGIREGLVVRPYDGFFSTSFNSHVGKIVSKSFSNDNINWSTFNKANLIT